MSELGDQIWLNLTDALVSIAQLGPYPAQPEPQPDAAIPDPLCECGGTLVLSHNQMYSNRRQAVTHYTCDRCKKVLVSHELLVR